MTYQVNVIALRKLPGGYWEKRQITMKALERPQDSGQCPVIKACAEHLAKKYPDHVFYLDDHRCIQWDFTVRVKTESGGYPNDVCCITYNQCREKLTEATESDSMTITRAMGPRILHSCDTAFFLAFGGLMTYPESDKLKGSEMFDWQCTKH